MDFPASRGAAVLLVRAGALGDILLLRGVVASLRAAGRPAGLLAPEAPGRALLGHGPCEVDRLIPWERAEVAALLCDAAPRVPPPDLSSFGAVLAYTRNDALVQNLRRVVSRVVVRDPVPPEGGGHASDWYADAVRELGFEPRAASSQIPVPEELRAADAFGFPLTPGFLAIHPGSGSRRKNWPPERFAELVSELSPDRPWLLVAGPAETDSVSLLSRRLGAVVAQELPPRVLGAVLSSAGVYVGNDSGISHLAAAWGVPAVALFGPTDPAVWAPVGDRVRVVRSADGTMAGIPVASVLETTLELREGHA